MPVGCASCACCGGWWCAAWPRLTTRDAASLIEAKPPCGPLSLGCSCDSSKTPSQAALWLCSPRACLKAPLSATRRLPAAVTDCGAGAVLEVWPCCRRRCSFLWLLIWAAPRCAAPFIAWKLRVQTKTTVSNNTCARRLEGHTKLHIMTRPFLLLP